MIWANFLFFIPSGWGVSHIDPVGQFTTEWTYNSADQVNTIRYPGGVDGQPGDLVDYSYLPQLQLSAVTVNGTTYLSNIQYDEAGRPVERSFGMDGLYQASMRYYPWNNSPGNSLGRLQEAQVLNTSTSQPIQHYQYDYDSGGNILQIRDWVAGNPQSQSYSYDWLDRLTSAFVTGGNNGQGDYPYEEYGYEQFTGRLIAKAGDSLGYNDGAHPNAVTHRNDVESYRYDANGNMTWRLHEGVAIELKYDGDNRLIEAGGIRLRARQPKRCPRASPEHRSAPARPRRRRPPAPGPRPLPRGSPSRNRTHRCAAPHQQ